jgi:hypothetical protein
MAIKCTKWTWNEAKFSIAYKAFRNIPQLAFLVWTYTIWQPCLTQHFFSYDSQHDAFIQFLLSNFTSDSDFEEVKKTHRFQKNLQNRTDWHFEVKNIGYWSFARMRSEKKTFFCLNRVKVKFLTFLKKFSSGFQTLAKMLARPCNEFYLRKIKSWNIAAFQDEL